MITYKIIANRNSRKDSSSNQDSVKDGSKAEDLDGLASHKAVVLARALSRCGFKPEDVVKIKGTAHTARVLAIVSDSAQVNWTKTFPHYIHIECADGIQRMAHHSQLKKIGRMK